MSITDKVWDTLTQVIKMNDNVAALSRQVALLATEMREMDRRLIRVEAMLELALRSQIAPPGDQSSRTLPEK